MPEKEAFWVLVGLMDRKPFELNLSMYGWVRFRVHGYVECCMRSRISPLPERCIDNCNHCTATVFADKMPLAHTWFYCMDKLLEVCSGDLRARLPIKYNMFATMFRSIIYAITNLRITSPPCEHSNAYPLFTKSSKSSGLVLSCTQLNGSSLYFASTHAMGMCSGLGKCRGV